MKYKHHGIMLIILVAAVLALSGCSGSNTATVTPTPAPGGSAAGTPTPAATAAPTATQGSGTATTLSDLYSKGGFSWISYRQVQTVGDQKMTVTMKMEMLGQEMHEGKMMNHVRIKTNWGNQEVWSDPDTPADANTADFTSSKAALTRVGPDSVTIDGKTYACTKYTATVASDGTLLPYTFWASPDAPAPVQYTYASADGTVTTQLTGWG